MLTYAYVSKGKLGALNVVIPQASASKLQVKLSVGTYAGRGTLLPPVLPDPVPELPMGL